MHPSRPLCAASERRRIRRFQEGILWRSTVSTDIRTQIVSRRKRWSSQPLRARIKTTRLARVRSTCRGRGRSRVARSAEQCCSRSPSRSDNAPSADSICTPASSANTLNRPAVSNVTSEFQSVSLLKTNATSVRSIPCGWRSRKRRPAKGWRVPTMRGRRSTVFLKLSARTLRPSHLAVPLSLTCL